MCATSPKQEEDESAHVKPSSIKSEDEASPAAAADATQKQPGKRRTKTGCLTCRKRRIKCGEEKPVCRNCTKSKRECAGYAPPLVYKQQNQGHGDVDHLEGDQFSFQEQNVTHSLNLRWQAEQQYQEGHHVTSRPEILAYPHLPFDASYHAAPFTNESTNYTSYGGGNTGYDWQTVLPANGQPPLNGFINYAVPQPSFIAPNSHLNIVEIEPELRGADQDHHNLQLTSNPMYGSLSTYPASDHLYRLDDQYPVQFQQRSTSQSLQYGIPHNLGEDHAARRFTTYGSLQNPGFAPTSARGLAVPHPSATVQCSKDYEDPEDPFDVEMEDTNLSYNEAANNLTDILGRSGQPNFAAAKLYVPRRTEYKSIATYGPPVTQSPLRDERNEQIFCHFVEITSNTMSIFERHHFSPIAAPARTLWNFTIPALALGHAALAHAMLAIGALHLAKLNNTTENPAVKHFTYAVRRVGRLLGLPQRRHETTTLATVMLLGYYEVVAGDHSRWNLHLSGAARLILEHDYAGLTRAARRMRVGAKARLSQWTAQFALTEENYARVAGIPITLLDDLDWEVDQALISRLLGVRVDYDHQYQPNFGLRASPSHLTEKDVEELRTKMSLRWWYCKQDIFQSMVSGDQPLMSLEHWLYCPPRGQFGRADAPYATLDHLLLVMARLCDFGGRDRSRKQKMVAAQGGQWKPPKWLFGPNGPPMPAGMKGPPGAMKPPQASMEQVPSSTSLSAAQPGSRPLAPSANEGRSRQSKPSPPGRTGADSKSGAGPPMFGMVPPSAEPPQLNSAFRIMDTNIKDQAFAVKDDYKTPIPSDSLEEDTVRAMAEYEDIRQAFNFFADSLGSDFEPLKGDGHPIPSPFGPALVYRNAAIACVWACYHMARISLQRLHPEMPPAAMVAAGVTAHLTREHAQMVGKTCAGLYATQQYGQTGALDPSFAGALMESTFFLLFAGIQYSDPAQRGWTVSKLKDIERRCGWRTSGAVAAACETAWERLAQAGRGPPYERVRDIRSHDARVSGVYTRSDNAPSESGKQPGTQHESEFINHDRSLIDRSSSTRVHWALGLLSVEEDIKAMTLKDK